MEQVVELESEPQWNEALGGTSKRPLVLLKHSTRCPISAEAYDQFQKHVAQEANPAVDYAIVLVVESRPVSNAVAESLGVKHESPQLLLIRDGKAVWHTSHWRITTDALRENIK